LLDISVYRDAPVTVIAPPDAELTPLDWVNPLEVLVELDELVDEMVLVDVEPELLAVDVELVPGMVAALTAPSNPTPASAVSAAPTVMRFSRRRDASRARTGFGVRTVGSMAERLRPRAKPNLGGG